MLRRQKKKGMKLKPVYRNIFEGRRVDKINVTDHFLERWNERLDEIYFSSKEELERYLLENYDYNNVEYLYGDHYNIGGTHVTATYENNGIVFITTMGNLDEQPVLYNMICSGKLNYAIREYGKLNLCN
jgi:hypothetical protein